MIWPAVHAHEQCTSAAYSQMHAWGWRVWPCSCMYTELLVQAPAKCFEAMLSITMQEGKTLIPVLYPIAVSDRQV